MTEKAYDRAATNGDVARKGDEETSAGGDTTTDEPLRRLWMVERTYSSDSPNILVIVYATPDGSQYLQQERSHHGFARSAPTVTAAIDAPESRLAPVADPAERDRYETEAAWMREQHDPNDSV